MAETEEAGKTYWEASAGRVLMGRLGYGTDLLEELNEVCRKEDVRLGRVEALGAVQKAHFGYYDQVMRAYRFMELGRRLEILNLTGNVSLRSGEPFVHAHITLGDDRGGICGGHLAPGTTVFACEFMIHVLEGPTLERVPDERTGLPLWAIPE